MYQILDGGARHFFAGGWLSFCGDDCGSHRRLIVMGPYSREPSFCNAVGVLAISVRIGIDISDNVNILPSNTRATQAVLHIDPIDGGARAGNGEGNKDQPSPGAVFRDDNRVLPVKQKAVTHEN